MIQLSRTRSPWVGGPWTLVLGLMVWAIMFAGETYRKEKNQAALFLKECEFGRSSRPGWAIMEQRRELEPIMYNFVWNLESDKWLNVAVAAKRGDAEAEKRLRRGFRPWLYLVIKPQYPHVCLSAYWTWKVKMLVEIPGMGMKLNVSFTASRKGLEQGDTASFPAQLRLKKDGLYYAVCEIDPALYPGEASFAQVTATGKVLLSVEGSLCQSDFRSAEEETRSTISTMVGLMTP